MDPKRLLRRANKTIADFHIFDDKEIWLAKLYGAMAGCNVPAPRVNNIYFDIELAFKCPCNMCKHSIEQ